MLDLELAATGLLPMTTVARLSGLTVAELKARHGDEIAAAQDKMRGEALLFALHRQSSEAWTTALAADDAAWEVAFPDPLDRRLLRGSVVLKLIRFARGGAHWRNVEACAALLALDDDDFLAAADAAGLKLCDRHRGKLAADNRALICAHLKGIVRDEKARKGLRLMAGRALLAALR